MTTSEMSTNLTTGEKERLFELYYQGRWAFLKDRPDVPPSSLSEGDVNWWRLGYEETREALEKLRSASSP